MTTETLPVPAQTIDLALLKAVGLDRLAPEQRELAMAIARRYDLDLLLKHLVMIEGRPYITRDALLWIAHRSGQFDGIQTTTPEIVGDEWRCTATVWRKDMGHPFTYGGRYPTKGGNQRFAPEMAIKVAESMALRRAFNVAAPVAEERWDLEAADVEPVKRPTLAELAEAKAEALEAPGMAAPPEPDPGDAAWEAAKEAVKSAEPGMTVAAFNEQRKAAFIPTERVQEAAHRLYPDVGRLSDLSDQQRLGLWLDLQS